MDLKRLNLGCGNDIKEGWVNLDKHALQGIDVVHDLNSMPLPFKDGEFDEVLCQDVLEHVNYTVLLGEVHRILKPGGVLTVRVPHFTSVDNFVDPTHVNRFSYRTFEYFLSEHSLGYYFDYHFSAIVSSRITFRKKLNLVNYLVEPVVNLNYMTKKIYEMTFFAALFPAHNILVKLIK